MIGRLRQGASRLNAPLVAAAAMTLLCAAFYLLHRGGLLELPGLDDAENGLIDIRFHARGARRPVGDDIVIVGLDDATRARAPELWQRRAGWARLIEALGKYEPRAIGIDAFFQAPEIVLPRPVLEQVRAARELVARRGAAEDGAELAAFDAVLEETRGDEKLAAAVAAAKVVHLGVLFYLDDTAAPAGTGEPRALASARYGEAVAADAPRSRRPPSAAADVTLSLPAIAAGARGAGFVNVVNDEGDGSVRRAYAVIERAGRYYAPLGLVMARERAARGDDLSYVVGEEQVLLGERPLVTDRRARLWLDFLGPKGAFPYYSAVDVAEGKVARAALAGKLVFVGPTDVARDRVETPFDPLLPGVEIHATLAHNALHGEFLRRAGPLATLAAMLGLGGLLTLLQLRRVRTGRAWLVLVVAVAGLAAYVIAAFWLFSARRVIIDMAAPSLAFVIVALASLSAGLIVEGREKAQIKNAFSQYLDDRAIAQILADPSRLRLGGERRELSVLFSDIRGFSLFPERLDPQQLSAFLNEYLTPMTDLVMEAGGLLDKYIGDAVMAVFGAPLEQSDHAARACRTALAMQQRLATLNQTWVARGLPRIAIGIGVSSGPMSVGNMGSQRRFDYTVVGDTVNLGARLEALTKEYGAHILVGERVCEQAGDAFVFRELDLVRLKGKDRSVRVYELLGERGTAVAADVARFDAALAAYRERRFDEAEAGFAAAAAACETDAPARVFAERARRLRATPPPEDWDGVYEQLSK